MASSLINLLKKIPIDLGQETVADYTEGKQIALRLVPTEGQGKSALDVGARMGEQTRFLTQRGYRVTSVDIEPRFEACLTMDANQPLPFKDNQFDLIWCSEVIEHLQDPAHCISEFRRITRSGGHIIMTTPNSYAWFFRLFALFGLPPHRLQRADHIHFFSLDEVRDIAPDADLYGYFPYMLIKRTIRKSLNMLTPTFIIHIKT